MRNIDIVVVRCISLLNYSYRYRDVEYITIKAGCQSR